MASPGLVDEMVSSSSRIAQVLALIEGLSELAEVLKGAVLWGLEGPPPQAPTEDEAIDVFHVIGELILFLMGIELEDQMLARIPENGAGVHGYTKNGVEICFIIVLSIMILFTVLGYFNGWGPPDEGEKFDDAQSELDHIHEILKLANADPDQWSSDGAAKYNTKNRLLFEAIRSVENADKGIVEILQHQAAQVAQARIELESTMGSLEALLAIIAGVASCTFRANPVSFSEAVGDHVLPSGVVEDASGLASPQALLLEKWLLRIVLGAAISAVAVAISFVAMLIDEGYCNARRLERRKNKYEDVHDDVIKIIQSSAAVRCAPATPVPFPARFWSMPTRSDASATVCGATAMTGGRADISDPADAVSGDGSGAGNRAVDASALKPVISQEPRIAAAPSSPKGTGQPPGKAEDLLASLLTRLQLSGPIAERIPLLAATLRKPPPVYAKPEPGDAAEAAGGEHGPAVPVEVELVGAAPAPKPIWAQRNVS